jgi:CheY-like chemotaxis protein
MVGRGSTFYVTLPVKVSAVRKGLDSSSSRDQEGIPGRAHEVEKPKPFGSTIDHDDTQAAASPSDSSERLASGPSDSAPAVADGSVPPLRILLVEDTAHNRILVLAFLKQTGYLVDIAENGLIGLEKYKAKPYDVVLMDIEMPVMDGYTATREIRKWEAEQGREPAPIIVVTAHALKEDQIKSRDAGCNAHLTKPIDKTRLLTAIREAIGGGNG